jgi:hypothetical protein
MLLKAVENKGKLGKGLTKQDHIVIVGGPCKSLNGNYYYSAENDVNFSAERTAKKEVGHVNIFKRHNKVCMKGRARRVEVLLD